MKSPWKCIGDDMIVLIRTAPKSEEIVISLNECVFKQ